MDGATAIVAEKIRPQQTTIRMAADKEKRTKIAPPLLAITTISKATMPIGAGKVATMATTNKTQTKTQITTITASQTTTQGAAPIILTILILNRE